MRLANVGGRPTAITAGGGLDLVTASSGSLREDFNDLVGRLDEVEKLIASASATDLAPVAEGDLAAPIPSPRQVFAVGLNYAKHAAEAKRALPSAPTVFTKYPTCLTGPRNEVTLPSPHVDWEVELVVVIGRRAEFVAEENAWDHVAGLTVGQDLSERHVQHAGPAPQFSLGKSFRGFGPTGPYLVTLDEIEDRDAIGLACAIDGETVQNGNTRDLLFDVPTLVSYLSTVCPLLPGDLIFTGTPSGVGVAREPQRFLEPGQTLTSWVDGVGEMRNRMVGEL